MVLFFLTTFIACSKSSQFHEPKTASLKSKDCADLYFPNETVKICFDSLLTDSRCPKNAVCIWEGYAAGKFTFTAKNQTSTFDLSATHDLSQTYTTDTIIAGYKIEFSDLAPYPDIMDPSTPGDKTAILKITKQ